jgi:hypothetical protein
MNIIICSATVEIPTRTFWINYSVRKRTNFPVVKEFLLRLIFTLESCSSSTLRDFFGFDDAEISAMISELEGEKLIKWESGLIELTNYSKENFENVQGSNLQKPRYYEVVEETDRVGFELLTFSIIAEKTVGSRSNKNLEVLLPKEDLRNLKERAEKEFDRQFDWFREKAKKVDIYNDDSELYQINSISTHDDSTIPLKVRFLISVAEPDSLKIEFVDQWVNDWDYEGKITSAIQNATSLNKVSAFSSQKSLKEYYEATLDPILALGLSTTLMRYCDPQYSVTVLDDTDAKVLVGAIIEEKNSSLILKLLDMVRQEKKIKASGVLWIGSPKEKVWARSSAIDEFSEKVATRLDSRTSSGQLSMLLAAENKKEAYKLNRLYSSKAIRVSEVSSPFINHDTEILLVPGLMVVSLMHMRKENFGHCTMPVGFVSFAPKYIDPIQNRIAKWLSSEIEIHQHHKSIESSVRKKELLGLLGDVKSQI